MNIDVNIPLSELQLFQATFATDDGPVVESCPIEIKRRLTMSGLDEYCKVTVPCHNGILEEVSLSLDGELQWFKNMKPYRMHVMSIDTFTLDLACKLETR